MSALARFQPADGSSAAIEAAMAAVASEQAATTARIVALREERAATLLTGTSKAVAAIEAGVREAEIDLERLAIIASELEPRLASARVVDTVASIETKRQEVTATIEAANVWFETEYPRLAGAIADGLRQCYAAENAIWEFGNAVAASHAGGDIVSVALPTPPRTSFAPYGPVPPHRCTQLPPAATGSAIWWPADLLGRLTHADVENALRSVPESQALRSTLPASTSASGQAPEVNHVEAGKPAARNPYKQTASVAKPKPDPEQSRFAHLAGLVSDPNAKIDPALKDSRFAHFARLHTDPEATKKAAAAARMIAVAKGRR